MRNAKWITACFTLIALIGCSSRNTVVETSSASIELIPVTQTISLNADAQHLTQSKSVLTKYLDEFKGNLSSHNVTITVFSKDGMSLQRYANDYLARLGVPEQQIQQVDLSRQYNPLQRFDFNIALTEYIVHTADCKPSQVGQYFESGNGCAAESSRLRSLVSPATMLGKHMIPTY